MTDAETLTLIEYASLIPYVARAFKRGGYLHSFVSWIALCTEELKNFALEIWRGKSFVTWRAGITPYFQFIENFFTNALALMTSVYNDCGLKNRFEQFTEATRDYNKEIQSFLLHVSIALLYSIPIVLFILSMATRRIELDRRGFYIRLLRTLPFILFHTSIHLIPANVIFGLGFRNFFDFLDTFPLLSHPLFLLISSICLLIAYSGFTRAISIEAIVDQHYMYRCSVLFHVFHFVERVLIPACPLSLLDFFMEVLFLVLITTLNFFIYWFVIGLAKDLATGLGFERVEEKEDDSKEDESSESTEVVAN